jgi:hypothetical protein
MRNEHSFQILQLPIKNSVNFQKIGPLLNKCQKMPVCSVKMFCVVNWNQIFKNFGRKCSWFTYLLALLWRKAEKLHMRVNFPCKLVWQSFGLFYLPFLDKISRFPVINFPRPRNIFEACFELFGRKFGHLAAVGMKANFLNRIIRAVSLQHTVERGRKRG